MTAGTPHSTDSPNSMYAPDSTDSPNSVRSPGSMDSVDFPDSREMPPRMPLQERSRATRTRLLETAITCLAELGWAGSSVVIVAERAGVSRGAAQHHFPTRERLFTAAVVHVADLRLADFRAEVAALPPGPDRTYAVLDLISGIYRGPLFRAALQLWTAAAVDPELRAKVLPLESMFAREVHAVAIDLLGLDESLPQVRDTVMATLDLARGLGLADVLSDDSYRRQAVLRRYSRMLDDTLAR